MEWSEDQQKQLAAMIRVAVEEAVPPAIKVTVNGKIDRIDKKLDEHNLKHQSDMDELKPYLQFASGLGIIFKLIVAIGSIAMAWLAIKGVFYGGDVRLM